MFNSPSDYREICNLLNYVFNDKQVLAQALTRKSGLLEGKQEAHIGHNGRLEFLGDSILRTAVDDILLELYPDSQEDDLSDKRDTLVSKNGFLSKVLDELNFDQYIIMGNGERANCQSTGRQKILADVMEALIGAVFIDSNRNYNITKRFIANHAGLQPKIQANRNRQLFIAVKRNDLKKVTYWLKQGANPNVVYEYDFPISGTYRLFYQRRGYIPQPLILSSQANALELAICCDEIAFNEERLAIIRELLRYDADPNTIVQGLPLLHIAIDSFSFSDAKEDFYRTVTHLLLKNKADTSLRDKRGFTPLELAVACADSRYVEQLLEFDADPNQRNSQQKSALHLAVKLAKNAGYINIVRTLLEFGAKPNLRDVNYQTALHIAAKASNDSEKEFFSKKIIDALLEYGADISIRDDKGKLPVDYTSNVFLIKKLGINKPVNNYEIHTNRTIQYNVNQRSTFFYQPSEAPVTELINERNENDMCLIL